MPAPAQRPLPRPCRPAQPTAAGHQGAGAEALPGRGGGASVGLAAGSADAAGEGRLPTAGVRATADLKREGGPECRCSSSQPPSCESPRRRQARRDDRARKTRDRCASLAHVAPTVRNDAAARHARARRQAALRRRHSRGNCLHCDPRRQDPRLQDSRGRGSTRRRARRASAPAFGVARRRPRAQRPHGRDHHPLSASLTHRAPARLPHRQSPPTKASARGPPAPRPPPRR